MNSLASTAMMRESGQAASCRLVLGVVPRRRIRWMNTSSSVGCDLGPAVRVAAVGRDRRFERRAVGAADVQRLAERRDHVDARLAGELARQPVGARTLRLEGDQAAIAAISSSPVPRAISLPLKM